MKPTLDSEIKALISLLDDPDEFVYNSVEKRLIEIGFPAMELLSELESVAAYDNKAVHERCQSILNNIHRTSFINEVASWYQSEKKSLLEGLILIAKFENPSLNTETIIHFYKNVKKNVWLEINRFQSSMDQMHAITSIVYHYFNLKAKELAQFGPSDNNLYIYGIHSLVRKKEVSNLLLGAFILCIAEDLDIPIKSKLIMNKGDASYPSMLLKFMEHTNVLNSNNDFKESVAFFFDPSTTQTFEKFEAVVLFKTLKIKNLQYFNVENHESLIVHFLINMYFTTKNETNKSILQEAITKVFKIELDHFHLFKVVNSKENNDWFNSDEL